ncbi:MAG: thiol reductant ABC exporter subunit CydC [Rhodobacteraceae bacterium]|nr:thiol reductant ABC exporter subunit CydC [Paracoccaceae bacterium]
MSGLRTILAAIWAAERRMLLVGGAATVVVLLAGAALLGLSGWFITAAATAGLAGTGAVFDVFRPSAAVRLLALGRAAGRYGERLWTHDATLRAVSWLRVVVLRGHLRMPLPQALRLRASDALNRLTSDIDLLDLLTLRFVFPVLGGAAVLLVVGLVLSLLTTPLIGWGLALIQAFGITVASALSLKAGQRFASRAEAEAQILRSQLAEILRQRDDLAVQGRLMDRLDRIGHQDIRSRRALRKTLHRDRLSVLVLSLTQIAGVCFTLAAGLAALRAGLLDPAHLAIGAFTALALGEVAAPFQRAFADLGRMRDATERVAPLLAPAPASTALPATDPISPRPATRLSFDRVSFRHPGAVQPVLTDFSAQIAPGEVVALQGPSGHGKSTLLALGAGLLRPDRGQVRLNDSPLDGLDERDLRRTVGMLPQRSELLSGTVLSNLQLAAPDIDADEAWAALDAAGIGSLLRGRDGLTTRIGESGRGLSGGERRRIALARVLVRKPAVLLLDEPTEGLNRAMAESVLSGVRTFLPDAAILTASHRAAELSWADRIITFK